MLAIVKSLAIYGLEGYIIQVEVDVANGLPAFDIVGLPAATVREAKERVRTAIRNAGLDFPLKRITVNLAPADVKKEGPGLDLAIAVGILTATAQLQAERLLNCVFLGELSLDGTLRAVPGVLPMAGALDQKHMLVIPNENAGEAALVQGIKVLGASSLQEVVSYLRGEKELAPGQAKTKLDGCQVCNVDFRDIKGQAAVKRALEVAAAGNHNIIIL